MGVPFRVHTGYLLASATARNAYQAGVAAERKKERANGRGRYNASHARWLRDSGQEKKERPFRKSPRLPPHRGCR